ncbi:hypothetical protein BKA70DRAFT_1240904 [Coprinopsis sp. MPI-PUGE-AT-0042]|nr:hypothetical protein BKA70DRAFT_1240904 [Coprinopsis sp. MPI-PUGE-AT-0042]
MPKNSPFSPAVPTRSGQVRSLRDHVVKDEVDATPDRASPVGGVGLVSDLGMRDVGQVQERSLQAVRREKEDLERRANAMKLMNVRLRAKLGAKTEQVLELRSKLQQMRKDMETMERESDKKDELLDAARKETEQYRTWWLNEIQFMKLMLNKVPEPNKDLDLVRTAQAHYLASTPSRQIVSDGETLHSRTSELALSACSQLSQEVLHLSHAGQKGEVESGSGDHGRLYIIWTGRAGFSGVAGVGFREKVEWTASGRNFIQEIWVIFKSGWGLRYLAFFADFDVVKGDGRTQIRAPSKPLERGFSVPLLKSMYRRNVKDYKVEIKGDKAERRNGIESQSFVGGMGDDEQGLWISSKAHSFLLLPNKLSELGLGSIEVTQGIAVDGWDILWVPDIAETRNGLIYLTVLVLGLGNERNEYYQHTRCLAGNGGTDARAGAYSHEQRLGNENISQAPVGRQTTEEAQKNL